MNVASVRMLIGATALVVLSACGGDEQTDEKATTPTQASPTGSTTSEEADRAICVDLDSRGGSFYQTVFLPLFSKTTDGPINVNSDDLDLALRPLKDLQTDNLEFASADIADMAERLKSAARTYKHREDATALGNSFGILAAYCYRDGNAPLWFEADEFPGERNRS